MITKPSTQTNNSEMLSRAPADKGLKGRRGEGKLQRVKAEHLGRLRRRLKLELAQHTGDAQFDLLVGEAHADAVARTQPEGHVRVGDEFVGVLREEALRQEAFR